MNDTHNYRGAAFVYDHTIIIELSFMSDVSTDDYLIGIQFHTVESSKTPIMHHCLIKVRVFFSRTHEILSKKNISQVLHAVLSRIIVLRTALHCPALIHSPAAYKLWNKRLKCMWDSLVPQTRSDSEGSDHSLDRLKRIHVPQSKGTSGGPVCAFSISRGQMCAVPMHIFSCHHTKSMPNKPICKCASYLSLLSLSIYIYRYIHIYIYISYEM